MSELRVDGPLYMDPALAELRRRWIERGDRDAARAVSVTMLYDGQLADLEAAGLRVATVLDGQVMGSIAYADLDRLAALDNVHWIAAGDEQRLTLNTSVADIRARASSVDSLSGSGRDGLWYVDPSTGELTSNASPQGATGAGVVVAVIDTGIDITHPAFNRTIRPPAYDSRIVRIWDQGLRPAAGESPPDASLIASGVPYGVEYTKEQIDRALNASRFPDTPLAFNHRDCNGHGTHVASIAAGGTKFAPGADAWRVGVAPQASIVVVKAFDTPPVRIGGTEVSEDTRFRDALFYCLRVAKGRPPHGLDNKPVVVNCSFGNAHGPADGFDLEDRLWESTFDPNGPADSTHFPRGAILVKSAGNDGDARMRMKARITIPAGGRIEVPFELIDTRGPVRTKYIACSRVPFWPPFQVTCWLAGPPGPGYAVEVSVRLPGETPFSTPMRAGFLARGFGGGAGMTLSHTYVPAAGPNGPLPDVHRHRVTLRIDPNIETDPPSHVLGMYELRFTGPPGTVIHAMCDQSYVRDGGFGFRVAHHAPPSVVVTGEQTLGNSGARNIITAAAYDELAQEAIPSRPQDPGRPATPRGAIAPFSARGPLRDFGGGARWPKPDVAAPGVDISAARSRDTESMLLPQVTPAVRRGNRFMDLKGTSQAAPHVAGVIALMLEKNPNLSVDQVRAALTGNVRAGSSPAPGDPLYPGAYGAGMVDAARSHGGTP